MLYLNPSTRSQLVVVFIFTWLISSRRLYSYSGYELSTKYCYSCMSEDFLLHWPYLDEVYYRPTNFTDHCYEISKKTDIGTVPCSHSMCVTVVEPKILAGQHIGNNIIRGCLSGVFKYVSTLKLQPMPVLENSCTRMPAHKLLPNRFASRSSNRTIELCWCAGQLCNYYPSVAVNKSEINKSGFAVFLTCFIMFFVFY